ncbi:putative phosphodiesterase [Oxalobacteraceae bacterium GrIS 1.11]
MVNLGDSLSGPLLPLETARFLMAQEWTQLAGNHERQVLQLHADSGPSDVYARAQLTQKELDWIAGLRPSMRYAPDVFLCHGTPASDASAFLQTAGRNATAREVKQRLGGVDAALVACGHTHVARNVRCARGQLIVNPGSVGQPAYADDHPHPHVIESGSPDARYAIVERRAGAWSVDLIAVSYDHQRMAALARERCRPDWDIALRTGYMAA